MPMMSSADNLASASLSRLTTRGNALVTALVVLAQGALAAVVGHDGLEVETLDTKEYRERQGL